MSASSPTPPAIGPIAAEIHFDNTGSFLYVTEVGTSLIDTYSINHDGTPGNDRTQNSFGNAPFAFAFDPENHLLVTEVRESPSPPGLVDQGAVTSYRQNRDGTLNAISGSVPDSQTAPCWIAITPDGRHAYAVNTGSGVISGYQVGFNGQLSLLGNGVTAQTPTGPLDNAITANGRYLYDVTSGGSIIGFLVRADGALTSLDLSVTVPAGSRGLVAE